ncbi:hypothetical protein OGAPHI_002747 [Ogataea philodendri]|uniref:Uncharacterized protein n=1 Tax=Ogataea philodendri TaxID=1378263 RepID=A0A9P8PBT9_9ASCO|nr:uncharacterized protein OGAPHI_002747 [Ogataea philodendri]KAH3668992.1 hypothetical protein OGAPHI_002747 [Ogataea philodendri]
MLGFCANNGSFRMIALISFDSSTRIWAVDILRWRIRTLNSFSATISRWLILELVKTSSSVLISNEFGLRNVSVEISDLSSTDSL